MSNEPMNAYKDYLATGMQQMQSAFESLSKRDISAAANMILEAQKKGNRLHVSGIGKPAYVAEYAAALLSSTGTPAYFCTAPRPCTAPAASWCRGTWSFSSPTAERLWRCVRP